MSNCSTATSTSQDPIARQWSAAAMDRDMALHRAVYLAQLMQWVEAARSLLEDVRTVATHVPEVKDALIRWEVPFNAASWDTERSDALHGMLSLQQELIAQAGGAN
jgi:hypothetical protein